MSLPSLRLTARLFRTQLQVAAGSRVVFASTSGVRKARVAAKSSTNRLQREDWTEARRIQINQPRVQEKTPKLVIFDKYGTLIDFHRTWTPWLAKLTKRLEQATGKELEEQILKKLDICHFTKKARSGILAEGTTSQIKRHIEQLLTDSGYSCMEAQLIVERTWVDGTISDRSTLQEVTDLKAIFQEIRRRGIKIGVLTSGNRQETMEAFKSLNLESYIDCLICGNDPLSERTQSRVEMMCDTLGVLPKESVLVGDTAGDVLMASDAGIGRTIGVLTGIGTRLDLYPHSDIIANDVEEALPFILDFNCKPTSPRAKPAKSKSNVSLVIFDKDGTLICFSSMWTPWVLSLAKRLEEVTGLQIADKLLSELGYCHLSDKWRPGIFAEGTTIQNMDVIKKLLMEEGFSPERADGIVQKVWKHGDHSEDNKDLKPIGDPAAMFKTLKERHIKVAVCTADSRQSTEQFLKSMNAEQYVDMLVCGDDPDAVPKPAAHNALKICKALGVAPEGSVVVGDTVADMGMGREAKLGATVAVLSGVGDVSDLDPQADVILPSISDLLSHVIKESS